MLILYTNFAPSNWKWDAAKPSSIICSSKKLATSYLLEQYFVTILYKYRLAHSRPLTCLKQIVMGKENVVVISVVLIETKNWKAMNFEYMSWLSLKVLSHNTFFQVFLLLLRYTVMVGGSFVYCDDLLVS